VLFATTDAEGWPLATLLEGLPGFVSSPQIAAERFEGAERCWHFRLVRGWFRPQAAALRGAFIDCSPVTLRTGTG